MLSFKKLSAVCSFAKAALIIVSLQTSTQAHAFITDNSDPAWKALTTKVGVRKAVGLLAPFSIQIQNLQNKTLYSENFGGYLESKPVTIASAAKWLTTAIVFAGIERGHLSLETTTGDILGWEGEKSNIPLWTLLSFTSGLDGIGNFDECYDPNATLQECARRIGKNGKQSGLPADAFAYGAVHLQIAAAMLEKASGLKWHEMATQWLFEPLEMKDTYYFSYGDESNLPAPTFSNPGVAGAAVSTTADYQKFLMMLLQKGVSTSGRRLLEWDSIQTMEQNFAARARKKPPFVIPFFNPYNGFSYALGHWIQCRDKSCPSDSIQSSVGSGGWYPWLDRKFGYAGLLSTEQTMENEALRFNATKQLFAIQKDVSAFVEKFMIRGDTK
jgi:serine-type D-Ala-D-Ala carboxypeptidase/endopeptidase